MCDWMIFSWSGVSCFSSSKLCPFFLSLFRFFANHLAGGHGGGREWPTHVPNQHPHHHHLPKHQTSHNFKISKRRLWGELETTRNYHTKYSEGVFCTCACVTGFVHCPSMPHHATVTLSALRGFDFYCIIKHMYSCFSPRIQRKWFLWWAEVRGTRCQRCTSWSPSLTSALPWTECMNSFILCKVLIYLFIHLSIFTEKRQCTTSC